MAPAVSCRPMEMVIEAKASGVWRVKLDSIHDQSMKGGGCKHNYTKRVHKKWHTRRVTQQTSTWANGICHSENRSTVIGGQEKTLVIPTGVRLWHASETARKLLLMAKHDLSEIFKCTFDHGDTGGYMPHKDKDVDPTGLWETRTLFISPSRALGFKEGMSLLGDQSPYLSKLCTEYALIACRIYGLSMNEFHKLTRMNVMQHRGGMPIRIQESGGGLYDSGPILTIGVGKPHIFHDLSPILIPEKEMLTPVRVMVPEGVMMVMDGYAKSCYGHGYAVGDRDKLEETVFYSINFYMDSMRETLLLGYVTETGDVVMQTPVIAENVVQINVSYADVPPKNTTKPGTKMLGLCPIRDVIQTMRAHLQAVESANLLSTCRVTGTNAQKKGTGNHQGCPAS